MNSFPAWSMLDRMEKSSVAVLLASGLLHLPVFVLGGADWEDPASMRKAVLFGISTGLTLWSLLFVLATLSDSSRVPGTARWKTDERSLESVVLGGSKVWSRLLCASLLAEVALITLQCWRGQASHFNTRGAINSAIEMAMLLLIAIACGIVVGMTVAVMRRNAVPSLQPPMRLALRSGMVFLLLSCLAGFVITAAGKFQISRGLSPETWGEAGVLKYPHGVVLHALQSLAILAWLCDRWRSRRALQAVAWGVAAHAAWFAFALIQTFMGRGRWELDPSSAPIGAVAIGCSLAAAAVAWFSRMPVAPITSGDAAVR